MSFNATLEEISKKMGTGRPKTERLIDLDCPPYGLVLKREFSDTGRDVHVPKLQDTTERGRATTVKRAAEFVKKRNRLWRGRWPVGFLMRSEGWGFRLEGYPRLGC